MAYVPARHAAGDRAGPLRGCDLRLHGVVRRRADLAVPGGPRPHDLSGGDIPCDADGLRRAGPFVRHPGHGVRAPRADFGAETRRARPARQRAGRRQRLIGSATMNDTKPLIPIEDLAAMVESGTMLAIPKDES